MQGFTKKLNFSAINNLKNSHMMILGFLLYLSVLIVNDGFMALDEYFVGITRYIPAQSSSLMTLVAPDDVKSPLQLLPMHAVAQLALFTGIESPYWQYRLVILVLGIINFSVLFLSILELSKFLKLERKEINFLMAVFIFYFAAPFSLTRPMFESIAAPWLTWSAIKAFKYDREGETNDLLWGVLLGSIAFVLRQQLGFCALVFVMLPIIKKNWSHLFYVAISGLSFFILSGIPDYFIRGKLHYSLLNLTVYNYQHGSDYGDRTLFFYPILIFIVCLAPFFIKKYPTGFLKDYFLKYRSLLIVIFLFIFLHSLFPQKWERFIVSVIPVLLILMFPFLKILQKDFKQNKLRLISLYSLNGFLFVIASFFPAQKNLIQMSLYLNRHSEITKIYRVADTPGWITEAFILNKKFEFIEADALSLEKINWADCSQAFVVGAAQADLYRKITDQLKLNAQFDVNLIEQLAFITNPKNNLRRVQLKLYSACDRDN